jgi:type VI secretion system protein ImpG
MSDELLPYYNRELSVIRHLAAQFAQDHPKIAGRLRLGEEGLSEDPHVERMIEAFAYLNARTRHKLEDEFPELTEALLGVLYPHYQAPIPSLAIVQFELDPGQKQLTTGHTIPRHTPLETEPIEGEPCRFRTCYPVTLWPISIQEASWSKPPFMAPTTRYSSSAKVVLRLVLICLDDGLTFAELAIPALRFFLKGQPQYIYRLYELILNNALGVALANGPNDAAPVVLDPDCLRPVGFEPDEGLLPYSPRSFVGYRLLTEYFAFAEKFLFVDLALAGLGAPVLQRIGNRCEIYLYLNRSVTDLEPDLADVFRLGCTPIVNLYEQRSEPIALTQTDFEYRVVPDVRRPLAHEIYTIERVTATAPDGSQVEYLPFFSVKHALPDGADLAFWYATRKPAEHSQGDVDHGTEIYLTLVDLGFELAAPSDWTLDVQTVCLNRDLPNRLPFGGDQPHLQLSQGGELVSRIACLTPPTRTLRPARRQGALWRLISHLSLNHLSLVENDHQAEALREILKLYDFTDTAETRKMIDGLVGVSSKRVVGRLPGATQDAFCRGVEVTLRFNEDRYTGSGLFLFASVLERFLALYCTVNSFTRLIAKVEGRDGELRRWQPHVGEKIIV